MMSYKFILIILVLFFNIEYICHAEIIPAKNYDGTMIYQVPFGKKIETTKVKLYPHYLPLREEQGWTYALIDVGYKLTNPIMLEDIPEKANKLIGRKIFGEKVFIILSGKGYTEIRKNDPASVKKIYWEKGDTFVAPNGYWVGHANPYVGTARILTLSVNLTNDILDPDIKMKSGRPVMPYLLRLLPYEHNDVYAGEIKAVSQEFPTKYELLPALEGDHSGYTIYRTNWGTPVNLQTIEMGINSKPLRGQAGWKNAHIGLGGKILNHSIIQDIFPKTKEIGHRHGHEVIFLGIKGKGRMSFRKEKDSFPLRIDWEEGDLFCLPWYPAGTWHAHSNESDQPARIFASVHHLGSRDQMLNPYLGQIRRSFRYKGGSLKDYIFD